MTDKIEVGEYVRTEREGIRKIIGYDDDNNPLLDNQTILTKIETKIVKHSKNILDIIESQDFLATDCGIVHMRSRKDKNTILVDDGYDYFEIEKDEILSIVTREQFSQIEYKV